MRKFGLPIVLLVALALRAWGLSWGLPLRLHIDETAVVHYSFRFLTGSLNPAPFFDYPTLHLYLLGALDWVLFIGAKLSGKIESLDEFARFFMDEPKVFYLAARAFSVFLALLTIRLVWKITLELWNEKAAFLASLALALFPLHVLHSHYGTVDVSNAYFVLLAFWVMMHTTDSGFSHLIAGIFCGLAAGVKYSGGAVFLALIFLHVFRNVRNGQRFVNSGILWAGLGAALAFFVTSPFLVLDFGTATGRWHEQYQSHIHWNTLTLANWEAVLRDIWQNMGPPLAALAGVGFLFAFVARDAFLLAPAFVALAFWLVLGSTSVGAGRNGLLFYPFLFILAFGFTTRILARAKPLLQNGIVAVLAALIVWQYFPQDLNIGHVLTQDDTRVQALAWIRKNVPPKAKILRFPHTPEFQKNDPFQVKVDWEGKLLNGPWDQLKGFDYFLISSFDPKSFPPSTFAPKSRLIQEFSGPRLGDFHNPTVRIYKKTK